ncbi:hypothetical protein NM688_g3543 [Phlebia brevispora]|uniref:Uncharacterized protein n=1 Tax=Phlebia brevispora TaxID=194682 RepID=A0ACC1T5N2_9APHY|nr:hypothetical protein NM688_g3543 [Phlebia brevispora]
MSMSTATFRATTAPTTMSFSPRGELLAVGLSGGSLLIINYASDVKMLEIPTHTSISCITWHPFENVVFIGFIDGSLRLQTITPVSSELLYVALPGSVQAIAYDVCGRRLGACVNSRFIVLDEGLTGERFGPSTVSSPDLLGSADVVIEMGEHDITSMHFVLGGQRLVCCFTFGVAVYDVATSQLLWRQQYGKWILGSNASKSQSFLLCHELLGFLCVDIGSFEVVRYYPALPHLVPLFAILESDDIALGCLLLGRQLVITSLDSKQLQTISRQHTLHGLVAHFEGSPSHYYIAVDKVINGEYWIEVLKVEKAICLQRGVTMEAILNGPESYTLLKRIIFAILDLTCLLVLLYIALYCATLLEDVCWKFSDGALSEIIECSCEGECTLVHSTVFSLAGEFCDIYLDAFDLAERALEGVLESLVSDL